MEYGWMRTRTMMAADNAQCNVYTGSFSCGFLFSSKPNSSM